MKNQKVIFFDTETTGLKPEIHDIIDIGGIIEINGEIVDEFSYKCRPHDMTTIEDSALNINNITREELVEFPDPSVIMYKLKEKLSRYINPSNWKDSFVLAGHNVHFDVDMLKQWWIKCGYTLSDYNKYFHYHTRDTLSLACSFVDAGIISDIENLKLTTLASYFGIGFIGNAHEALPDARVSRDVYYKFVNYLENAHRRGSRFPDKTINPMLDMF